MTIIMVSFAAIYFIFEIVLNVNDIDNDTSNVFLLEWSKGRLVFIPFALGAIGGHLFLGTKNDFFQMSSSLYPVIILFGVAALMVVLTYLVSFKKSKFLLSTLLLAGFLYGHLFWSMNYQS
ncbi:hypothetical protein ACUNWD_00650 [Sunxiuqinia sp. A32]|uniref:hypothetical protein n=1 Tax=Sunxiuqinia sp. A32 TaxID=3461496 RepID=UPI00404544DF